MSVVAEDRIGTELAGYRIERVLGRGGMSVVYLAHDPRLKRNVALKLLAPELVQDEGFRVRFLRESQLAASLDHPNVVPIYEAGGLDGLFYIAMRYVDGTDLKTWLRREGALDADRALALVGVLERGLAKLPAERWQTAGALVEAARAAVASGAGRPFLRSHRLLVPLVAAAAAAAAIAVTLG